jgi:polyhydroxyalkanoate synthase
MNDIPAFSFYELINSSVIASQRIVRNYLKNVSGYHHDLRDITLTYSSLFSKVLVSPKEMLKMYNLTQDFLIAQQEIWKSISACNSFGENTSGTLNLQKSDRRFSDPEWVANPYFNFIKQNYLLAEKYTAQIINEIELDDKIRRKVAFYIEQYMAALSPSNFLLTNPGAMRLAIETNGESLRNGINNLVADLEKGKISQTDETAFEVGKNIAVTVGSVVYENELIQLIQYSPLTKNVYEIPLLIIPPWINKYYILDLQSKNSFVKFLVEQGITVFIISWRNPKPGMGDLKFDDYVKNGVLKALAVIQDICSIKKVNTLGYCLGGTLLSIACSILSLDKKENPIHSATFLATMIDFSDIGPMGDVIDGALIRKLERGELLKGGILNGRDMETAFNLIRANDLIWIYVINSYLKGLKPSVFDVIYWTNDNTNLPGNMYLFYMKRMILENKLSHKNALRICDTSIDIGKIDVPVFVISFKEDTISPAITGFTTTELVSGPVEFIMGESGHVMGVVNTPYKKKYGYYLNGRLGSGFEKWKETASYHEGSWWIPFVERLVKLSGIEINAPANQGSNKYKIIEAAPGRYVKEKC